MFVKVAAYQERPSAIALDVAGGALNETAQALASNSITTIVGFTEIDRDGRLFNAAAIIACGLVAGVYRKMHPAINRSVYHAGTDMPVFDEARHSDIARAKEHRIAVIRADVAGRAGGLISYGSSAIVDRHANVLVAAPRLRADLLVAGI